MSATPTPPTGFRSALQSLAQVQKSSKGAPPYSLFVNRRLGRLLAAAAYQFGLTPNMVTYISAALTLLGLVLLSLAPATWWNGLAVSVCLVLGYAFDSADGQLARLRGGGSMLGEWLDHTIDSFKVSLVHVAVMICWFRHFNLEPVWLLVPLGFSVVSAVHFFGMILVDLLARVQRAALGLTPPAKAPANMTRTLLKVPTDYGILCLAFVLLGAHSLFVVVYTLLAVATAGYTFLAIGKWRRDVIALDAMGAEPGLDVIG